MKAKYFAGTILLYPILILAQTNEIRETAHARCKLAESISLEFKDSEKTTVLGEESVKTILKTKSSEEITDDLNNYADIFQGWAKQSSAKVAKESANSTSISTNENRRSMLVREFKQEFGKTGPIDEHGGIIRVEMLELADRHYTNAAPSLRRIAEVELPKELGVPTCARVKSHYQKPAAEAWVTLAMPGGLSDDQKKAWLDNFIESEKGQGQAGKKWAIEAAERMLRKINKPKGEGVSPAKP